MFQASRKIEHSTDHKEICNTIMYHKTFFSSYTHESAELQTRKLGDLYFMFGNYNMAFQAYHQAKRDFNADSAWQYYAGALEMAALSAFMLGTANRKTYDYMEDAIVCYLNTCK